MGQSASQTCWSLGWVCVSMLVSTPSPAHQSPWAHSIPTAGLQVGFQPGVPCLCVLVFLCVSFICHRHLLYLGWARISLHLYRVLSQDR